MKIIVALIAGLILFSSRANAEFPLLSENLHHQHEPMPPLKQGGIVALCVGGAFCTGGAFILAMTGGRNFATQLVAVTAVSGAVAVAGIIMIAANTKLPPAYRNRWSAIALKSNELGLAYNF